MTEVPAVREALTEALALSGEILRNIELSEAPLATVALKAGRLARLLNDFDHQTLFGYEAGGYPSTPDGVEQKVFAIARLAQRVFFEKEKDTTVEKAYLQSIEQLEAEAQAAMISMEAARDPNISISSANPSQYVWNPQGNASERNNIRAQHATVARRLAARRAFIYDYVTRKHYELRFSGIVDDLFSRVRERVDSQIGKVVPDALKTITAIYDNLASENPEDWSNAVHGCRRLLQDLADVIYPPTSDKEIDTGSEKKKIKMGQDHYINRLIAFAEQNSESQRFNEIVGSHIRYLGERLDSIFRAAQKGSHAKIATRAEADRYVTYTYMMVGDLLALLPSDPTQEGTSTSDTTASLKDTGERG